MTDRQICAAVALFFVLGYAFGTYCGWNSMLAQIQNEHALYTPQATYECEEMER